MFNSNCLLDSFLKYFTNGKVHKAFGKKEAVIQPTVHNRSWRYCLDVWTQIKREFWLHRKKRAAPFFFLSVEC